MSAAGQEQVDFFVSHAGPDEPWAAWIDQVLLDAGFSTITDLYDFEVGRNFVLLMSEALDRASRVLLVWSSHAMDRYMVETEWTNAMASSRDRIVPVIVGEQELPSILKATLHIDISQTVGEVEAREKLIGALVGKARPSGAPPFPGQVRKGATEPRLMGGQRTPSVRSVQEARLSLDSRFAPRRDHVPFTHDLKDCREIWIQAKGLDSFLHDYSEDVLNALKSGTRFRLLMHDPANISLMKSMAATSLTNRNYRQVGARLRSAVAELARLSQEVEGIELRLAQWPLVNGYTFYDAGTAAARVYVELFGYQVSLSERRAAMMRANQEPELYKYHYESFSKQWRDAKKVTFE